MTKIRQLTLGQTSSVFRQTTRLLKPDTHNSQWEEISLPYDLNPGDRVKIRTVEKELGGEYYIVQDICITDVGIVLVRTDEIDSKDKYYSMVAFNMGNSAVSLSYGDKLGYAVYI